MFFAKGKSKNKRNQKVCAVAICKNPPDSRYYRFPKDEELKKVWIQRCSRKDKLPKELRICDTHFTDDCFLPDIKSKITGELITKRLNRNMAIPTLYLSKVFPTSKLEEIMKVKRVKSRLDYDAG